MNILITGASSGLGKALAENYANKDTTLVLLGRNEAHLDDIKQVCISKGAEVHSFSCDITDQNFEDLMLKIADKFAFDLVFANAGINLLETFQENQMEKMNQIKKIIDTNFLGAIKTIFPLIPGLRNKKGRIVITSSLAQGIGLPQDPAYSASKAALTKFFEGFRPILKKQGIATTILLPGFIDTPLSRKVKDPKPFCLSDQEAVAKIKKGIQKNNYFITFPKLLQFLMSLRHLIPKRILDKILMTVLEHTHRAISDKPRKKKLTQ